MATSVCQALTNHIPCQAISIRTRGPFIWRKRKNRGSKLTLWKFTQSTHCAWLYCFKCKGVYLSNIYELCQSSGPQRLEGRLHPFCRRGSQHHRWGASYPLSHLKWFFSEFSALNRAEVIVSRQNKNPQRYYESFTYIYFLNKSQIWYQSLRQVHSRKLNSWIKGRKLKKIPTRKLPAYLSHGLSQRRV